MLQQDASTAARAETRNSVELLDTTLRDGSHAATSSVEAAARIVAELEGAGVTLIEVGDGDGIGAPLHDESAANAAWDRIKLACAARTSPRIAVLAMPSIATADDLVRAKSLGINCARVAVDPEDAEGSLALIDRANDLGLDAWGFIMMCHSITPDATADLTVTLRHAGASTVVLADSAGTLNPASTVSRVKAAVSIPCPPRIGFHGHRNLGLAEANSVAACGAGATVVDATLLGLGAGGGNAQIEIVAALLGREGFNVAVDIPRLLRLTCELRRDHGYLTPEIDEAAIVAGMSGMSAVAATHARDASDTTGVPAGRLLILAKAKGLVDPTVRDLIGMSASAAAEDI